MIVLLLLALLGGLALFRRSDPFAVSVGSLLLAPLIIMPLGLIHTAPGRSIQVVVLILLVLVLSHFLQDKTRSISVSPEFVALTVAFAFFYGLSGLWPDFVSIGERLRDYAILSSVIDSPSIAREPWLHGSVLNYYLYWYRFGAMLATLGGLDAAHTYHVLVSFTFALYFASLVGCARSLLGLSTISSIFVGLVISIGSNLEGILAFLQRDTNWWRPSRILDGGYAISEFPAWSFLLGDAHPHYLNLALAPLFVLSVSKIVTRYRCSTYSTLTVLIPWALVTSLWVYGANAWELPAWLTLCGLLGFGWILRSWYSVGAEIPELTPSVCIRFGATAAFFSFLLWLAIRNITPADAALTLVADPVRPSLLFEFLRHWGVPFAILALLLPLQLKRTLSRFAAYAAILLFMLLPMPGYLIGLLLLCAVAAYFYDVSDPKGPVSWVVHAIGVSGLILVLFPELLFFNDPYGGETERMNTIFKFYSAAWFMIYLYAFGLLTPYFKNVWERSPAAAMALSMVVLALLSGFFFRTVQLRKIRGDSVVDVMRGLRSVEREFPGSAAAISFLDEKPRSVVLEAQGNPYSYTSFVSTLSNHDSYLGWANHVNLLTKEFDRIRHREEVTREFYESEDCEKKRGLLRRERIAFAVVGELERRAFPQLDPQQFQCLTKVFELEKYAIYAP